MIHGVFLDRRFISSNERRLTAMEGLEDRLGLWLRRMSTAPTTSESMATNKASVAYRNKRIILQAIRWQNRAHRNSKLRS